MLKRARPVNEDADQECQSFADLVHDCNARNIIIAIMPDGNEPNQAYMRLSQSQANTLVEYDRRQHLREPNARAWGPLKRIAVRSMRRAISEVQSVAPTAIPAGIT